MAETAKPDPADHARFLEGLALLNAGEAFDAHEVWEELWLQAGGARARFLQGMIQLAVARVHWEAGRLGPARRLLERGRAKLRHPGTPGWPAVLSAQQALDWSRQAFAPLEANKETGEPPAVTPLQDWPELKGSAPD